MDPYITLTSHGMPFGCPKQNTLFWFIIFYFVFFLNLEYYLALTAPRYPVTFLPVLPIIQYGRSSEPQIFACAIKRERTSEPLPLPFHISSHLLHLDLLPLNSSREKMRGVQFLQNSSDKWWLTEESEHTAAIGTMVCAVLLRAHSLSVILSSRRCDLTVRLN